MIVGSAGEVFCRSACNFGPEHFWGGHLILYFFIISVISHVIYFFFLSPIPLRKIQQKTIPRSENLVIIMGPQSSVEEKYSIRSRCTQIQLPAPCGRIGLCGSTYCIAEHASLPPSLPFLRFLTPRLTNAPLFQSFTSALSLLFSGLHQLFQTEED